MKFFDKLKLYLGLSVLSLTTTKDLGAGDHPQYVVRTMDETDEPFANSDCVPGLDELRQRESDELKEFLENDVLGRSCLDDEEQGDSVPIVTVDMDQKPFIDYKDVPTIPFIELKEKNPNRGIDMISKGLGAEKLNKLIVPVDTKPNKVHYESKEPAPSDDEQSTSFNPAISLKQRDELLNKLKPLKEDAINQFNPDARDDIYGGMPLRYLLDDSPRNLFGEPDNNFFCMGGHEPYSSVRISGAEKMARLFGLSEEDLAAAKKCEAAIHDYLADAFKKKVGIESPAPSDLYRDPVMSLSADMAGGPQPYIFKDGKVRTLDLGTGSGDVAEQVAKYVADWKGHPESGIDFFGMKEKNPFNNKIGGDYQIKDKLEE